MRAFSRKRVSSFQLFSGRNQWRSPSHFLVRAEPSLLSATRCECFHQRGGEPLLAQLQMALASRDVLFFRVVLDAVPRARCSGQCFISAAVGFSCFGRLSSRHAPSNLIGFCHQFRSLELWPVCRHPPAECPSSSPILRGVFCRCRSQTEAIASEISGDEYPRIPRLA